MVSAWWRMQVASRPGSSPIGRSLTGELAKAMARRNFVPGHDRGRVLVDVAVMPLAWWRQGSRPVRPGR